MFQDFKTDTLSIVPHTKQVPKVLYSKHKCFRISNQIFQVLCSKTQMLQDSKPGVPKHKCSQSCVSYTNVPEFHIRYSKSCVPNRNIHIFQNRYPKFSCSKTQMFQDSKSDIPSLMFQNSNATRLKIKIPKILCSQTQMFLRALCSKTKMFQDLKSYIPKQKCLQDSKANTPNLVFPNRNVHNYQNRGQMPQDSKSDT